MQKLNEDCFYFLTASCAKGASCTYRHNPSVLTCNVICPSWSRGSCLNPACSLRHSTVQSPTVGNNILCYYESTTMGCLKPDCTFIHARSRPNPRNPSTPRPSTTNLVNKDAIKPTVPTPPPSNTPEIINEPVPSPQINVPQPSIAKVEIPPTIKTETVPHRIAVPLENEQTEMKSRSVVVNSSEKKQDDTKTAQPRAVANRNVVIAESSSVPSRKVVHGTTNRVVVSSAAIKSSKKITNDSDSDLDDLIEQENDTKQTNTTIDISFPCSAPSIMNRLFTSSKQSTPTNDTKPIRLNRDRLPASGNSIKSVSTPSNEEKTSPGTGLSQDDERRTSRIERFKPKPTSPPRSIVSSSSSSTPITSRNIIPSSPSERKRPVPEQSINDSPPSKRLSTSSIQQENNHNHNRTTIGDLCSPPSNSHRTRNHHPRRRRRSSSSESPPQRKSPSRQTSSSLNLSMPSYSSSSSMNPSDWKNEVDKFLARTIQPKHPLPITRFPPQPVPLLSLRPRYRPPPPQQPVARRPPPLQRAPPVVPKRPLAPVIIPPIEQPSSKNIPPVQPSTSPNEEDELLKLDESTDVVDTFALIDEALFEADHLLELM